MSAAWPIANLDSARRLRVVAAGVRGAAVTERLLPAEFAKVWSALTDFKGSFTRVQPDMRQVRVVDQRDERVELLALSRYGMKARLVGVTRLGWCWLQSRFLIIAMAAAPEPRGGTRVALTGGVRIPGRTAILPVGVRGEAGRSLDALQRMVGD